MSPEDEAPSPLPPILPNNFVTAHFPETEAPARQKIKSPISSQFDIKKYVYGEDQEEDNPLFDNTKLVNPLFDNPKQVNPLFDDPKQVNPLFDDSLLDKSNMDILSMIADITSDNYANLNSDKTLANFNSDKNYLNDNSNKNFANLYSDSQNLNSDKNSADLNSDKNSAILNSDKNFVGLETKNEILKQQLMELELALLDLQPQVSLAKPYLA